MELLERYLQSVRKYLPNRRQDDIIAELRVNMESQIEDKESELDRPLTEGEFEDLLRKMGPPVVVASRYQPQQYLIGPTLFPLYFYVLRVAMLWAFIVSVIVFAVVLPLAQNEPTNVFNSLFRIPALLVQVAGWVTLVFAAIEFMSTRYPQMCPPIEGITKKWHPQSLPPLEKEAAHAGKPRSFAQAIAEIVFGSLFLGWLLLVPKYPFLIMGPGAVYLKAGPFDLAPVWTTFFWWVVILNIFQIIWKCVDLARGKWQFPSRTQHVAFKVVGLVPIVILLASPDHMYVLLKKPGADQLQYGESIHQINNSIHIGFTIICAIVVLQLAWDLWLMARDGYRSRGLVN
jgi:hypothetical protein